MIVGKCITETVQAREHVRDLAIGLNQLLERTKRIMCNLLLAISDPGFAKTYDLP
jgi:hypothetical protein